MTEDEVRLEIEREIPLGRYADPEEEVAGVRPVGYRAPMWELNYHSPQLLFDHGFSYDSSLMNADQPYELAVSRESSDAVVELPISWSVDDWGQYCYLPGLSGTGLIESPTKTVEMWRLELDAMYREGACFILVNHPFLSVWGPRTSAGAGSG